MGASAEGCLTPPCGQWSAQCRFAAVKPGLLLAGLWLFIDSFFVVSVIGQSGTPSNGGTTASIDGRAYPIPPIAGPSTPRGVGVVLKPPVLGGFLPPLAAPAASEIVVAGPAPIAWPSPGGVPPSSGPGVKPMALAAGSYMLGQWGGSGGPSSGSTGAALPTLQLASAGNAPLSGSGGNGSGGASGGGPGGGTGTGVLTGGGSGGGGSPGGGGGTGGGTPILVPTGLSGPNDGGGGGGTFGPNLLLPALAPVPVPAAGFGLVAALAVLAGVGRSRKS